MEPIITMLPSGCVPALARGLAATRTAIAGLNTEPDAVFILRLKEEQFVDAINTALEHRTSAEATDPRPG